MSAASMPSITLKRTINNPRNDIEVLGFTGRNNIHGVPALVLKADVLPSDEVRVGIPDVILDCETWFELFITGEEVVYGIWKDEFLANCQTHTFKEWYGETITTRSINWEDLKTWDKSEVPIST